MAGIDLKLDWTRTLLPGTGLESADLAGMKTALEAARREVVDEDTRLFDEPSMIPPEKEPLDAGFFELPERLLSEYRSRRDDSELGQLLKVAKRMRESFDRVVVLGIGGSYMGARALMESCCHPYHNELSRASRGGRPRMYFEGNNVDNDSIQGLLELLKESGSDDRWGVIVISKSGGTLETAASFRIFMKALSAQFGEDKLANHIVPVTGKTGKLFDLATAIGCKDIFHVPDGVGGRFSILSPVGLLPAAVLGIDVVKLLEGAAAMNEHFRSAKVGENVVLDYTALGHGMLTKQEANLRVLSVWAKSLESVGLWYDQLLAESLGKAEKGATPLTVVNTRDLHSRAQQHQEGCRDKFIINLITEKWRQGALVIGKSEYDQDQLNAIAGKTIPQIMTAAIEGTNEAYLEDSRPTADLTISAINESTMGQLFQMLMLATVVEGRIMKINPYGQPGVEMYKKHMKRGLGQ